MSRFNKLGQTRQQFFDNKESNSRLAYERRFMRKFLRRLGISDVEMKVRSPGNSEEEEWFLTIGWLHANFPDMPIRLMAHVLWKPDLYAFFKPTRRDSIIWKSWLEACNVLAGETTNGRAIGCVFPAPDDSGLGDMIMHNKSDLPFDAEIPLCRLHSVIDDVHVTVETLDTFAARLALQWKPYF